MNELNYNQYISANHIGRYIYTKEVHTLHNEIELKRVKDYNFKFFIPASSPEDISGFSCEKGRPLKLVKTSSISMFKERVKQFNDYGHKCYGTNRLAYQYIFEEFDKTKINNKLVRIAYFDIETARDRKTGYSKATEAKNEVQTISLVINGKVHYWATRDLPHAFIEKHQLEFHWFMSEAEMLEDFISFIGAEVDVLSGWNIETYDIPYVVTRARNLDLDPNKLSPFGMLNKRDIKNKFGGSETGYEIVGVAVLDYLNLYKKFTYTTRDNYKLDTIAQVELGDSKVDYGEYKDLQELYDNDFIKFSEYSIKDSLICHRFEKKLKLIDLAITLAYKTGVNFQDVLGTVKMWTFYLYQEMMKKKIVPHMFATAREVGNIIGGFVKDPIRGKHKWTMSFDLASLYPHNQMAMNISFDKLIGDRELPPELMELRLAIAEKYPTIEECIEAIVNKEIDLSILKEYDCGMTPNLQFYKNDSLGIIPSILKDVYNERKSVKKEMLVRKQEKIDSGNGKLTGEISRLNAIQMALKILMNSEYGALGNEHFLWFDTRNAAAITSTGQVAIKFIAMRLNEFMNILLKTDNVDYVIAIDTDSNYIDFGPLVEKHFSGKSDAAITTFLDKFSKEKIQPFIDESYHQLAEYMNAFNMEWFMKREAIANAAVFVQKKRYFMHILDDEGVRMKEPKLKVIGLEAVRSSTPEVCRTSLKSIMKTILEKNEEEVQEDVSTFKKKFFAGSPIDISTPRSVSNIEKWIDPKTHKGYKSGTPIGVRGAIMFNRIIKDLDKSFETIKSGDKVNLIYLKEPNKFKTNVIALPNEVPEALGLTEDMIDRALQFEKTYLKPVTLMLTPLKWKTEKTNSLASFFG